MKLKKEFKTTRKKNPLCNTINISSIDIVPQIKTPHCLFIDQCYQISELKRLGKWKENSYVIFSQDLFRKFIPTVKKNKTNKTKTTSYLCLITCHLALCYSVNDDCSTVNRQPTRILNMENQLSSIVELTFINTKRTPRFLNAFLPFFFIHLFFPFPINDRWNRYL